MALGDFIPVSGLIKNTTDNESQDALTANRFREEVQYIGASDDVLCFPQELNSGKPEDMNHGHYIQFFIKVNEKAKLTFPRLQKSDTENDLGKAVSERGLDRGIDISADIDKLTDVPGGTSTTLEEINNQVDSVAGAAALLGDADLSSAIDAQLGQVDDLLNLDDGVGGELGVLGNAIKSRIANAKTTISGAAAEMGNPTGFNFTGDLGTLGARISNESKENLSGITKSTGLLTESIENVIKDNGFPYIYSNTTGSIEKNHPKLISNNLVEGFDGRVVRGDVKDVVQNRKDATVEREKRDPAIIFERAPVTRTSKSICMFMPTNIQSIQSMNYTDTQIGVATQLVNQAIAAYNEGGGGGGGVRNAIQKVLPDLPTAAADAILLSILGISGSIPGIGGLRESVEAAQGSILADRMELAFKGINKRQFQYTFKMIPKSSQEAQNVRKIIFAFRNAMSPEFHDTERGLHGRHMVVPATFEIEYMYKGSQNRFMHKIADCFLETMTVNYGGDRFQTFPEENFEQQFPEHNGGRGAPLVETTMTLNFKEIELITREKINEGY